MDERDVFLFFYSVASSERQYHSALENLVISFFECTGREYISCALAFRVDESFDGCVQREMESDDDFCIVRYDVTHKHPLRKTVMRMSRMGGFDEQYRIRVSGEQYRDLRNFLDDEIGEPFDTVGNFLAAIPFARTIGVRSCGWRNSQLFVCALEFAGVLRRGSVNLSTVSPDAFLDAVMTDCVVEELDVVLVV